MNENAEKYLKLLKNNIERAVIALLGLMLLGMIATVMLEKSNTEESGGAQTETAQLEDPLAKNPSWKTVQAMASPQQISQYPGIMQIRQFNMFDFKSVKDRESVERAANQKFDSAKAAFDLGRKDEARKSLEEILQVMPGHKRARDLLDKVNAPPAGAKPSPSPGTPR